MVMGVMGKTNEPQLLLAEYQGEPWPVLSLSGSPS